MDQAKLKIAFCGARGSFSEIAAKKLFPEGEFLPSGSFKEAYAKTLRGESDFTVLPLENSYAGEVAAVTDELYKGDLFVESVRSMRVVQNLLGVPGTTIDDVKTVVSHPQALSQCADYIAARGLREITSENTAFAAKTVAEAGDKSIAAIASVDCAEANGLIVLAENIAAASENATRFAVLGRKAPQETAGDRLILFFALKDESGALASSLAVIARHGYNLKAIHSRPLKEKAWHYYFYVEAEKNAGSSEESELIGEMRNHCTGVKIAGRFDPDRMI